MKLMLLSLPQEIGKITSLEFSGEKKKNTEKARVHPCEMSLSKLLIKPGSLVVMLLGPSDTLIVDYDYKACSKEKSFIQHSN